MASAEASTLIDALPANLATDDRAVRARARLDFAIALQDAPAAEVLDARIAASPALAAKFKDCPAANGRHCRDLMTFVKDRPGHDLRYAVDATKIRRELGWAPAHTFEEGIRETVRWYLAHPDWCARIAAGTYRRERLGLSVTDGGARGAGEAVSS